MLSKFQDTLRKEREKEREKRIIKYYFQHAIACYEFACIEFIGVAFECEILMNTDDKLLTCLCVPHIFTLTV